MKRLFTLLTLFLIPYFPIQAQTLDPNLESTFQDILEQYKIGWGVIGLSAAVKTDDGIWASAVGISSATEPLDVEHTFAIASVSKTIVSATILRMVEDGLLDLGDSIGMYLDEYENVDTNVTIRQLLNHTSGIFDFQYHSEYGDFVSEDWNAILPVQEVLESFINPPLFEPGEEWSYSNTNYILLGQIIKAVSGEDYYDEAEERFSFDEEYPSINVMPWEYSQDSLAHWWGDTTMAGNGPLLDNHELGLGWNSILSTYDASGAYAATPTDVARWAFDLYSGDLLSDTSMNEMLTITPPSTWYGLGVQFVNNPCGQTLVGHGGSLGYRTSTRYDRENRISVSVHCNEYSNVVLDLSKSLICAYDNYLATSTHGVAALESLEVYPNPTNDIVYFEGLKQEKCNIRVMNTLGAILKSQDQIGDGYVDLTNLPEGLYFLEFQNENLSVIKRIMKE